MSENERDTALEVAMRIADGEPVDWAEIDRTPGLAGRARGLKTLAAIAAAHGHTVEGARPEPHLAMSRQETQPAPEAAASSDMGVVDEQWGQLRIRELIGRGGFGEVYRAHHATLGKDFALKLLSAERARDPREATRFISEARRHAKVTHHGIVRIHDAGVHEGRAGIWMELIRGKTLETLLAEQGRYGDEEAAQIGIEMCGALAAVHAEGLVHRDVKTSNIMRREGGGYVLMDFSASIERPDPGSLEGRAPARGTPLFMSPETFEGAPASAAADIYSLGVVLYRLVSGKFPVPANDINELREKHSRRESVPLRDVRPDLPAPFIRLIERALAPDPADRYASAGEMERALESLRSPGPMLRSERGEEPVPRPSSWWWRTWREHPARSAVTGTVVALAVVALTVGLWRILVPPPPAILGVDVAVYRVAGGTSERLFPEDPVRPGDQLFLQIEASQEVHVYVMNEDASGGSMVIFPLAFLDVQNPLTPGQIHRLPGTVGGAPYNWDMDLTSSGGAETIFVIASLEPLPDLEGELEGTPHAAQRVRGTDPPGAAREEGGPPGEGDGLADPRGGERWAEPTGSGAGAPAEETRGITTASPAPPSGETAGDSHRLGKLFESLAREGSARSGIWTWQIRLMNEGN